MTTNSLTGFVEDQSAFPWIEKAPTAEKDYSNDWTDFIAQTPGDTISTSEWTVPVGITDMAVADGKPHAITAAVTSIWLKGGTLGTRYDIANTITTAAGRVDVRTFTIRVVAQ